MSRVYRALEKAEKEKQKKAQDGPGKWLDQALPRPEEPPRPGPAAEGRVPPSGLELPPGEETPILVAPPNSFAAEQFRRLRTHILFRAPDPPHSILITSTAPQEGKTMVAMNLALAISQEIHKRAVLVDADLRLPALFLEKHRHQGLSTYLADQAPLSEIMVDSGIENLKLIPGGPSSPRSPELIGSKRMAELLAALRALGDDTFTVIDSPPILSTTEPILLANLVEAVILVVRAERVPKRAIRRALDIIGRKKILGVVLNEIDLKASHYGPETYYERR